MPLSKLRGKDAQAALRGCGRGVWRQHGDVFSDVSGIRVQNPMEPGRDDLLWKYTRTIKAVGLMCCWKRSTMG